MNPEIVTVLGQLGLTEYEAKILATLFELRETEAPEISRNAQVPKTRVYDVLDRLTKRGLIIEIFGRPKKYRVIEPGEALDELVSSKKNEINGLEGRIAVLKQGMNANMESTDFSEKVMKVKDKGDFWKILGQEISGAKNEVIAFTPTNETDPAFHEAVKAALDRKVKVKIMGKSHSEKGKKMGQNGAQLRDHDHGLHAYIIDGQKVIMGLSDFAKPKSEYHFTIWNNHAPLAKALRTHFDACWNTAKP